MKNILFFTLLITCFYLSGCITIKQPEVTGINNFKLSEISKDMNVKFDVLLKNPNNYGLTLQNMQLDAFLGDSIISSVNLDKRQRINPNSTSSIPITVQPKVSMMPQLALTGLGQLFKKDDKRFKLKGTLVVRKFIFKKKYSFNYPQ